MSDINTDKLLQHLKDKWKTQPCPLCGVRKWNVQSKSFELREFHGGGLVLGPGPIIPVIPVVCTNCGNTILINSLVAGVEMEGKEKKNE
jgi:hypothetical protein